MDPSAPSGSSADASASSSSSAVEDLAPGMAAMSLQDRFELLRGIGEECIQEDELMNLLQKKPVPICYDGFEPSGRMHIAQGIVKTINVNKMVRAGCKVKIWIADWFAQLNNKMGGDLKKIQTVGRYMIEIWRAAGMNLDGVEFLWSSEEINNRANEYWPLVMDIACKNNVKRIMRCCQIMGRNDSDELTAAQIFYPCMQCADIFFLKADICQLGMDQRKAQVNLKIKQAFCPPNVVDGNPCLEYIKYIVFPWFEMFEVVRKEANGGNKTFTNMDELIDDYKTGALHPADVKPALAKAINQILQPIRDHFNNNSEAKILLNTVKKYRVTN
uniref:tyrosine--tRNA ligase n=2 Tax=Oryza sativa subsp. japonica TaxID=39947 RepID=Q6Z0P0_ORYSJ|nr:putative tyrosine-tRNA ligase [Oryza sativa Japonica Group]BAD30722.1 putative tyrosine-tRNA ligase [Oryza sativa Japonica Group]